MRRISTFVALLAVGASANAAIAQNRLIYVIADESAPFDKSIISINLDGSDPQTLHSGIPGLSNVLVDNVDQKLYYRDGTELRRSDLDGLNDEFLGDPAVCIASITDTSLSDDRMKTHSTLSSCDLTGAGVCNTPPNGDLVGSLISTETVPGSGSVYMMTDFCELAAMDQDCNTLTEVAEPFPGDDCFGGAPLEYEPVGAKLYTSAASLGVNSFRRMDVDGTNAETLFPVNAASDIVVDAAAGKIFWIGQGVATAPDFGLISANLDGTGETVLVSGQVSGLELVVGEPLPVPTVSEWGLAALSLLVLIAGTVILHRGGRVAVA